MLRLIFLAAVLAFSTPLPAAERDRAWAMKLEQPGLPNLYRVTPQLYRCAQPTADGLAAAEKLGIKTVINLRAFHADGEKTGATKLRMERIRFNTWHPEDEDVVHFLQLVSERRNGPFLVHCQHGADRTGTMIAIYRIAVQGWKKEDAIREMTGGGYGFHAIWKNLIRYLQGLDIEALKKQAASAHAVGGR